MVLPKLRLRLFSTDKKTAAAAATANTAETVFHPTERTRDQEWNQHDIAEAEMTAKREVGANYEEI